jgi:hypothetical protein
MPDLSTGAGIKVFLLLFLQKKKTLPSVSRRAGYAKAAVVPRRGKP